MMTVVQMRRIASRFGVEIDCSPASILSGKYGGATAFTSENNSGKYCLFRQREGKIKLVPDWNSWRVGDCANAIATAKVGDTPSSTLVRQIREYIEEEVLV